MRPDLDSYFLAIAEAVSLRAECTRRQVGAVLVKNNLVVSTGYNGPAPGQLHCTAGGCPRGAIKGPVGPQDGGADQIGTPGFCTAVHAELNCLLHAPCGTFGATMFITCPPCAGCRKAMAAAGIKRAVWPGGSIDSRHMCDWQIDCLLD